MKTVKISYMLLLILFFGLSGCAVTDFDRSADFSGFKTFSWGKSAIDVSNPLYGSELISKRIRETVESEFQKRGIVRAEANPDFLVSYHTYTEDKERVSSGYPYSYRFYPYAFYPFAFGWGFPYPWMTPLHKTEYTEGTLILDIVDSRTEELVWRGSVTGDVDPSALKKQIEKGVRAIIKKYPGSPATIELVQNITS